MPSAVRSDLNLMSEHIVPTRVYYLIFAALMVGTYLTVQAAFIDLGRSTRSSRWRSPCAKATLVVLFFMHVKYSTRLTWAVVVGSVFWLGILLALTFSDYLTRPGGRSDNGSRGRVIRDIAIR